ncbi:ABC transporter permease [Natrononativus amylolyticus]|uniref:ABC transporter permease n=1 Tax=Natrononativus amylolyticus TaxID=2963434 RepID=UPI0020CC0291|nr:ABC transporter permease [Natrononativus amylolyticus]
MKRSDTDIQTDGGGVSSDQVQSPFETVADVEVSRSERYRALFDEYVAAPTKILINDWRAITGFLITIGFVFVGTIGVWAIDRPYSGDADFLIPPFQSMAHPLGTDGQGQDILAQLVHATPAMLEMMAAGAIFSTVMAVFWGVFSGYKGGSVDQFMMAVADVLMTIPGLPLVVVLAAILDPSSPWVIGIILVVNAWAGFARALRSEVLKLRHESYVEASRTIGISLPAIVTKDVLPNVMPLIVVNFVTTARNVIMASVGLYFLGLLPHTGFNWGVMMNTAYGQGGVYTASLYHWFYAPMVTIVVLSLGLLLLGQGLDRIFNPRIRARHLEQDSTDNADPETDEETDPNTRPGGL